MVHPPAEAKQIIPLEDVSLNLPPISGTSGLRIRLQGSAEAGSEIEQPGHPNFLMKTTKSHQAA
jgi:hypothetical protein